MDSLQKIRKEAAQRDVQSKIAEQLHLSHDSVLDDELPQHFKELLRLLDKRLHWV
jgi:hypothetical protein